MDVLVVLVGDGGTGTGHAKLGSVGTTVAETAGEGAVDGGAGGEVDGGADVKDGGEPGVVGGGEVEDPENLQRGKGSVRCTLSIGSSLRTSTMARRTHPAPIESWYEVSAKMPELEREVLSVRLKHLSKKREKYALGTESSHHESDSEEDGELQIVGPGQKMLVFREVGGRTHLEAVGTNTIRRKGHEDTNVEEELEEDACEAKEMGEKEENQQTTLERTLLTQCKEGRGAYRTMLLRRPIHDYLAGGLLRVSGASSVSSSFSRPRSFHIATRKRTLLLSHDLCRKQKRVQSVASVLSSPPALSQPPPVLISSINLRSLEKNARPMNAASHPPVAMRRVRRKPG